MSVLVRMACMLAVTYAGHLWLSSAFGPPQAGSLWAEGQEIVAVLAATEAQGFEWWVVAITVVVTALAVIAMPLVPMWLAWWFVVRGTFWTFVFGATGALVLVPVMRFVPGAGQPTWWLTGLFALTLVVLLVAAMRGTFKANDIVIEDGGDHTSLQNSYSTRVMPRGRMLCETTPDTRTEERWGGGSYTTYQSVPVTSYGAGGTSYGTAQVAVSNSAPVYSYSVLRHTGRTSYRFREVGPHHALQSADKPKGVIVETPSAGSLEQISFVLGGWASLRLDWWMLLRGRLFFQKVWINQASRKIQQAAKQHLAQMKKRYGRFNRHRLTMDAELSLVRFVGSSKQKVFVCSRDPAVDVAIDAADAPSHWQNTRLLVDGHAFEAGSDVAAQLDKWSKVQALRTK